MGIATLSLYKVGYYQTHPKKMENVSGPTSFRCAARVARQLDPPGDGEHFPYQFTADGGVWCF
jgi:hypothetical protein